MLVFLEERRLSCTAAFGATGSLTLIHTPTYFCDLMTTVLGGTCVPQMWAVMRLHTCGTLMSVVPQTMALQSPNVGFVPGCF